jgi:hypothetical protein
MKHWAEHYIGRTYVLGESDCARLVCDVRREVFGLPVPPEAEPDRASSLLGRYHQMSEGVAEFSTPTQTPAEGDVVLMICRGRSSHVGAYCVVNGEPSVLHAMKNAGMTVLHRLRDLPRYLLAVEGFYRWK